MLAHLLEDARTILPHVRGRLFAPRPPRHAEWSTQLADPERGTLRLSGHLRDVPGSSALVLLIHGLGGSPNSLACLRGAEVFARRGVSTLSLALRGSDRRGEDFYNVALTADLFAALASPELARYERIWVLGYSMGGYVALHFAHECEDPRVRAVAAICTPLDLHAAQLYFDTRRALLYRRHVLGKLIEIYAEVARRRDVPTDPREVARVRTMYDWDRLTIAPRYGFASPEDYYRELSVVPRLSALRVPVLHVRAAADPVIPGAAVEPYLPGTDTSDSGCSFVVRRVGRAGHLTFPSRLDLGYGGGLGLNAQVHGWFARQP